MLETLNQFDWWLFKKINSQWTNPVFDFLFPFLREAYFWMPLYLFIFLFIGFNYKKNNWWWIILFLCTVAITDLTGTQIFKQEFQRIRPCNDLHFMDQVRLLIKRCGSGYSFISNHAANHFGMATFLFLTLPHFFKRWLWLVFAWAALITYAQVYVGIHYPLDGICGAVWGMAIGLFTSAVFNKKFGFTNFDKQPTVTP
ncbi:MAG: phosphoesterase [Chitinophagaceae bacterium]